eukprot:UN14567
MFLQQPSKLSHISLSKAMKTHRNLSDDSDAQLSLGRI